MDAEELAAWLGPDTGEDRDGRRGAWEDPPTPEDEGGGVRRWGRVAAAGAGVWLLVAVVLVATRGPDAPPAPADAGTTAPATAAPAPGSLPTATPTSTSGAAPAATAPTTPGMGTAAEAPTPTAMPMPAAGGTDEGTAAGLGPVLAVREALQGQPDGRDRYLEWATEVGRTSLGGGVSVVVVEAAWLEGTAGAWEGLRTGRWAVPVRDPDQPVGAPWPVRHQGPSPPPADLPVALERAEEAAAAVSAGGWADVVVHASEAHPDLPTVWRALVDGTGPDGAHRQGMVLWMQDVDGLQLLGVQP